MARIIEWDGEPFAVLIESPGGDYLIPPIVFDLDGNISEGSEVVEAIAQSGTTVEMPVVRAAPGLLAEIDRRMAHLSSELGVPIGMPWQREN